MKSSFEPIWIDYKSLRTGRKVYGRKNGPFRTIFWLRGKMVILPPGRISGQPRREYSLSSPNFGIKGKNPPPMLQFPSLERELGKFDPFLH